MKHLGLAVLTYGAMVLQSAVAPELACYGIQPHFFALALAVAVLMVDSPAGIIWSAGIGLCSDCFADHRLGIGLLSAVLVSFAVRHLVHPERRASVLLTGSLYCVSLSGWLIFSAGIRWALADVTTIGSLSFVAIAGTALYSTLIGLMCITLGIMIGRFVSRFNSPNRSRRKMRFT